MPAVHGALAHWQHCRQPFWFPAILALSLLGCIVGTYLSKAEDMEC